MKWEPPTQTRAPDNQFRQMQDYLTYTRNTSLLNACGWGPGGPYSIGEFCERGRSWSRPQT